MTLLGLTAALPSPAGAATTPRAAAPTATTTSDVREVPPGKVYALDPALKAAGQAQRRTKAAAAGQTPAVGTSRKWLALDDEKGTLYLKTYTLKAVGAKIEVWVASGSDATSAGTAFPAGDCRNGTPGSTDVTTAQAEELADQFDDNMFPKESAAFSVAPDRDGTNADPEYPSDSTGAGDKIVTLVDNVRDDNFYDFPARPTYIAGFFSSQFNDILDRNVMTIDAFDWLHRTGANPPNEPTSDLCTSRPARPRLYEGTFAHEYQHLLQSYTDPAEVNFVNEGLSDFAQTLVGYVDGTKNVDEAGFDSHISCFHGYGTVATPFNTNPRDCGGAQNSLTLWGDEGSGNEILADYGNAYSFMLYLYDHYGLDFMSALHRDGAEQGLAGVQAQLNAFSKTHVDVYKLLHDFQLMNLTDSTADTGVDGRWGHRNGRITGALRKDISTRSLDASVNLSNPASYAKPGAAPNGADYVQLRAADGTSLTGGDLRSLSFTGATTLPSQPLLWTVTDQAEGREGNPTLWSGSEDNLDSTAVTTVTVPTSDPTLTYTERHLAESGYDYAYTVVSTDGGKTYTALANANTAKTPDGPYGPALNGDAAGFVTQTFDLSAYAGKTILLGFRYVSDGGTNDGGWYVDDVKVGATAVSDGSTLAPFKSPTQIRPVEVANWDLRLVALDRTDILVEDFNGQDSISRTFAKLQKFRRYKTIVAVVSYDDPTEQVQQYAPYTLTVNGVVQPGGSS